MPVDPVTPPAGHIPTYWEAGNVLAATPGYDLTAQDVANLNDNQIPYHHLLGSNVGLDNSVNDTNAETLFPTYDGVNSKLPHPSASVDPDFETNFALTPANLDPDEFLTWHSAHQLEYIKKQTSATISGHTSFLGVTIGGSVAGVDPITVVVHTGGVKVFIVEGLQKRDFTTMTLQEQSAIAATTAFKGTGAALPGGIFKGGVAERLGLWINVNDILKTVTPAAGATTTEELGILGAITDIETLWGTNNGVMTAEERDLFTNQLRKIQERVEGFMGVFSPIDIFKQVDEIRTRFRRAWEFAKAAGTAEGHPGNTDPRQWTNVISLDGGNMVRKGYDIFIEQERKMLALDEERLNIASSPLYKSKMMDAPTLVFLFQLQYNLTMEHKSRAESEEINQQNDLLKTYAEMQRIINETQGKFINPKADPPEAHGLFGLSEGDKSGNWAPNTSSAADPVYKVISMFESQLQGIKHPIETLRVPTRPHENMIDNGASDAANGTNINRFVKNVWDSFATRLADAVTLINQEAQIKMNDINSMDKQKNRHFDLANSALAKLNETLQNIARSSA